VKMRVPFLDLRVTDKDSRQELLDAIGMIFDHGRVLLGPEVEAFEERIASYCDTKYAVGVASGSAAIFLAVKSIGIGSGDEIITTALSFIGTANGIALTGAKPIFVDILEDLTIDPKSVERAITSRTKAIMPVHFTGKLCDMPELQALAEKYGIVIIEDAAPAIGASLNGRKAGSFGVAGCISLNPMKILNACGEAGVVVTNDREIRDRIVALRYNGLINREYCQYVSTNGRIDTLQAAILLKRLNQLEEIIARRREIAAYYRSTLADVVEVPTEREGYRDVYYTFTIKTDRRDELMSFLGERGIETKVQHPLLMPQHPAYKAMDHGRFPVANHAVKRLLCIPAHEKMTQEQVEYVVSTILTFFGFKRNA